MKIYTKVGDTGTTSLIGGRRVRKSDLQVEVYGQLDELNSWIGLLSSYHNVFDEKDRDFLYRVQQNLFKVGGFYSFDFSQGKDYSYDFITDGDVKEVESLIDAMQEELPPLRQFIMPGGTRLASFTHIARTICRRCERTMDSFESVPDLAKEKEKLAKSYINRLSDYLFVLARYVNLCENDRGQEEMSSL